MGIHSGDIDEAAAEAADGYARLRELGDRFGMIVALGAMMQVAMARGEPADALRFGEEAYGYATTGVSPEQGAAILTQLAEARARLGEVERARADLERGMAQMERIGEFADAANASLLLCELSSRTATGTPHAHTRTAPTPGSSSAGTARLRAGDPPHLRSPRLPRRGGRRRRRGAELAREDLRRLRNDALMGNPTVASLLEASPPTPPHEASMFAPPNC